MFCSKEIKQSWEVTKSTRANLKEMGLAYDPNEILKIPNAKKEVIEDAKRKVLDPENMSESEEEEVDMGPVKGHVAKKLEAEAKAPRRRMLRLPNSQVHFLMFLIDNYGEDYKVMPFFVFY